MNEKDYYQFDLNFHGDSICGYCSINENSNFFTIEKPTFKSKSPNLSYSIKSKDDICYLSKSQVVCYYKIEN